MLCFLAGTSSSSGGQASPTWPYSSTKVLRLDPTTALKFMVTRIHDLAQRHRRSCRIFVQHRACRQCASASPRRFVRVNGRSAYVHMCRQRTVLAGCRQTCTHLCPICYIVAQTIMTLIQIFNAESERVRICIDNAKWECRGRWRDKKSSVSFSPCACDISCLPAATAAGGVGFIQIYVTTIVVRLASIHPSSRCMRTSPARRSPGINDIRFVTTF